MFVISDKNAHYFKQNVRFSNKMFVMSNEMFVISNKMLVTFNKMFIISLIRNACNSDKNRGVYSPLPSRHKANNIHYSIDR